MTGAVTWQGRRGAVILGPTEHRVARWLADMTRAGRITIRTVDVAAATHVERSEAYRILARLRVLGLFGIENDRGGTNGGRRIWRTALEHDGAALRGDRHREAWARVVGWARARRIRIAVRLAALRQRPGRNDLHVDTPRATAPGSTPRGSGADTFAAQMRRAGLGRLMDQWGVT